MSTSEREAERFVHKTIYYKVSTFASAQGVIWSAIDLAVYAHMPSNVCIEKTPRIVSQTECEACYITPTLYYLASGFEFSTTTYLLYSESPPITTRSRHPLFFIKAPLPPWLLLGSPMLMGPHQSQQHAGLHKQEVKPGQTQGLNLLCPWSMWLLG